MRVWKRIATVSMAALLALSALSGCGSNNEVEKESYKIGVVLKSLANPFYVTMADAIEEKGQKLGVEIVLQAPEKETDT